jgi:hypothetical protein
MEWRRKSMAYHTSMVMPFGPLAVRSAKIVADNVLRVKEMECNGMKANDWID